MGPVTAYLGLGSNLGRREENLATAALRIAGSRDRTGSMGHGSPNMVLVGDIQILRASSVYETSPWGYQDQPDFLNCVLEVCTAFAPSELLAWTKAVEHNMGRRPGLRFGPRRIDVDILLYGESIVDLPDLQIPHPRLHLRAFALMPLCELAQTSVHPTLRTTIADLADRVDGQEGVKVRGAPLYVGPGDGRSQRRSQIV